MALTMLCFVTDLGAKVVEATDEYLYVEQVKKTETSVAISQGIDIGLFALCNGLRIGEIADSYGGGNCRQDSDCECEVEGAQCQSYICNLHRGVCERPPAPPNKCTKDASCQEACSTVCKATCSEGRKTCDTDCGSTEATCKEACADDACKTGCETNKATCSAACQSTETTCVTTGCDATCTVYFCNLARGLCDRP